MNKIELSESTKQWAQDRGILTNGKITTQMLKLGSEFGELGHSLRTMKNIEDDIGDCMVVCTILEALEGRDIIDTMERLPEYYINSDYLQASHYLGEMMDASIKNLSYRGYMTNFISCLNKIANFDGLTITECWNVAYNDIKDRKGVLNSEGNFIKSTDEAYKTTIKELEDARASNTK